MEKAEVDVLTLDNGKTYEVIDKVNFNNNTYLLLVNELDEKDKCIRKQVIKDGKEYLMTLDLVEFKNISEKFVKNYGGEN